MTTILFACVHNAGRSQMAAALLNKLADPRAARAISAGTEPGQRVHPEVVSAMREVGIDLADIQPQRLTPELARQAQVLVTMGCGDKCPFVPGARSGPVGIPMGMSDALNEKFGMKPAGNDAPPIPVLGANFSPSPKAT